LGDEGEWLCMLVIDGCWFVQSSVVTATGRVAKSPIKHCLEFGETGPDHQGAQKLPSPVGEQPHSLLSCSPIISIYL